jgi:DNA-binding protein HU-beta
MTKTQLADAVGEAIGLKRKDAVTVVDAVLNNVSKAICNGERVSISGFGVFSVRDTEAGTRKNNFTGEMVKVKAKSKVRFTAAKALKEEADKTRRKRKAAKS